MPQILPDTGLPWLYTTSAQPEDAPSISMSCMTSAAGPNAAVGKLVTSFIMGNGEDWESQSLPNPGPSQPCLSNLQVRETDLYTSLGSSSFPLQSLKLRTGYGFQPGLHAGGWGAEFNSKFSPSLPDKGRTGQNLLHLVLLLEKK